MCHLTEGGQSKHLVELPLLGVPDEVSGVGVLLRAVERGPPEVRLAKQAEDTQLPVDLRKGTLKGAKSSQKSEALALTLMCTHTLQTNNQFHLNEIGYKWMLLTFRLVLNKTCLNACVLQRMASIRMITRSYSMYLSTGFLHDSCVTWVPS